MSLELKLWTMFARSPAQLQGLLGSPKAFSQTAHDTDCKLKHYELEPWQADSARHREFPHGYLDRGLWNATVKYSIRIGWGKEEFQKIVLGGWSRFGSTRAHYIYTYILRTHTTNIFQITFTFDNTSYIYLCKYFRVGKASKTSINTQYLLKCWCIIPRIPKGFHWSTAKNLDVTHTSV